MSWPITWADVVNVAPEAESAPVMRQNAILTAVHLEVDNDPETWGDRAAAGAALLAAHMNAIAERKGNGPITSTTEDRLSEAYASTVEMGGGLGATAYGVEYLRMLRTLPSTLGAVW